MNNQTNYYFGKIEENLDLSHIHLAVIQSAILAFLYCFDLNQNILSCKKIVEKICEIRDM